MSQHGAFCDMYGEWGGKGIPHFCAFLCVLTAHTHLPPPLIPMDLDWIGWLTGSGSNGKFQIVAKSGEYC